MGYVMIVDDDEDFASAAATVLRNAGHEVRIELDTDSAVTDMKQREPDLVILDVMFPENVSAGFELARRMRHHEENLKAITVVILTAVNERFALGFSPLGFSQRDIDDTWLPVTDFLEKPIDLDVLCNKVSGLLRARGSIAGSNAAKEAESTRQD